MLALLILPLTVAGGTASAVPLASPPAGTAESTPSGPPPVVPESFAEAVDPVASKTAMTRAMQAMEDAQGQGFTETMNALLALYRYSSDVHQYLPAFRDEKVQQLVQGVVSGSIGNKNQYMEEVAALEKKIKDLRGKVVSIWVKQDQMKEMAFSKSQNIGGVIRDTQLKHDMDMHAMKARITDSIETLTGEMNRALAYIVNNRQPIAQVIAADTVRAVDRINDVATRNNNVARSLTGAITRLANLHKTNAKTIEVYAKEFGIKQADIQRVLERLPEMLELKEEDLSYAIRGEAKERDREFQKISTSDAEKDLLKALGKIVQSTEKQYRSLQTGAEKSNKEILDLVQGDVAHFDTVATEQQNQLHGSIVKAGADFKAVSSKADADIKVIGKELKEEAKLESKFPANADSELAKIDAKARKDISGLKDERANEIERAISEFERDADRVGDKAKDGIDAIVKTQTQKGEQEVSRSSYKAEAALVPQMEKLEKQAGEAQTYEASISELKKKNTGLAEGLDVEKKKVSELSTQITKDMHEKDGQLQKSAEDIAKETRKSIKDAVGKTVRAKSFALASLQGQVTSLRDAFETKQSDLASYIKSGISKSKASLKQLSSMGNSATTGLGEKIDEVADKLDYVQKTTFPVVNKIADDFFSEATEKLDNMDQYTNDAIEHQKQLVDGHMDSLSHQAKMAIVDMKKMVTPEEVKNRQRASAADRLFTETVTKMSSGAQAALADADADLGSAESRNTEIAEDAAANRESIQRAFDDAKAGLLTSDRKATGDLEEQQLQLSQAQEDLTSSIDSGVAATKERATSALESAQKALDGYVMDADKESGSAWTRLDEATNRAITKVKGDASTVQDRSRQLGTVIAEGNAELARLQAMASSDSQTLHTAITAEGTAAREEMADATAQIGSAADGVLAEGTAAVENAEAESEKDIKTAETAAAQDVRAAETSVTNANAAVAASEKAAEKAAETGIAGAATGMASFEDRMQVYQQAEEEREAALDQRFVNVQNTVSERSAEFERSMGAAGKKLAALVSKDHLGMGTVVQQLENLADSTKVKTEKQHAESTARLQELVSQAKAAATSVHTKAKKTSEDVAVFERKLDEVAETNDATLQDLEAQQEQFDETLSSTATRFAGRVEREAMARKNQTSVLEKEANETTTQLTDALHLVSAMGTKVGARVQFQLGTLALDDQKTNRTLSDMEKLEEYTDAEAVSNVKTKVKQAWREENTLKQWKIDELARTREFRKIVDKELGKLGEELDMSAVELAEENAAEEFHVKTALTHLHDALGDDVKHLSKTSHARLQQISEDTGAQIAELMKDESLNEHQRATALAKIKADAEQRARDVLEDDGRLELDAQTSARNLRVRTDGVEAAEAKLTQLDSGAMARLGMQNKLDSIRSLLKEVESSLIPAPGVGSFAEMEPVPGWKLAEMEPVPGVGSLAEMEPLPGAGSLAEMVEARKTRTDAAAEEDKKLSAHLAALQKRLSR